MPINADRRHHIPKMTFKVRNWPAYEAGLRRRGSLTLWIEDAALDDCRPSDRPAKLAQLPATVNARWSKRQ
jgi:hypothetical protein